LAVWSAILATAWLLVFILAVDTVDAPFDNLMPTITTVVPRSVCFHYIIVLLTTNIHGALYDFLIKKHMNALQLMSFHAGVVYKTQYRRDSFATLEDYW